MGGKRVQITALGKWSVRRDGKLTATGTNQRVILHALVLGRGRVDRGDLELLLPDHDQSHESRLAAIRNTLMYLRKLPLDISQGDNPVTMNVAQADASVDLWEFFAHVDFERYDEAHALIADGQAPVLLANDEDAGNPIWRQTLADFAAAKAKVVAAVDAATGRRRSMLAARERLLARSLVPGVGRQVPIEQVRPQLEALSVPWRSERPHSGVGEQPLPAHLAALLTGEDAELPRQVVVVGGAGAGKTLAAISTYLQLTDRLNGAVATPPRTVLYVDADAEASQAEFGSDAWFDRRLQEVQGTGGGRPVVIMSHADAYLTRHQHTLSSVLDARVFRDSDVLLCCGEQLYAKRLRYEEFGTHVIRLEPWRRDLQRSFAQAIFGESVRRAFEAWVDEEPTREQLCAVPLHLVHVLSHVGDDPQALAGISKPWQLFDEVARVRLRVTGPGYDEDELFEDLAAVAHRHYVEATPSDTPVGFSVEELRQHLRARGRKAVKRRADAIVGRTLLTSPVPSRGELRFEEPAWGWFFVARHLVHTLLYRPQDTLAAFSKFLSADVMDLCEEMLREALERHAEPIRAALRAALCEAPDGTLAPGRRTIAREQVGYLLGALADAPVRDELAILLDRGAPTREPDHAVRRGIAFGLANGGAAHVADAYVERLRAERESGGPTPERDANIGFLLSFRGDQPFDPERPGAIRPDPDPVRTIADLVRGLEESRHPGSWRIKLFTLVDLAVHPAIPRERFDAALAPLHERLTAVRVRLALDPERRDWPELAELAVLLNP